MKRLWHLREILMLPIRILVVATLLSGISYILKELSLTGNSASWLNTLEGLLLYLSYFLISIVPLVIGMNVVYNKNKDSRAIILFFVIYVVFTITTMFFAPKGLQKEAYGSLFSFAIPISMSTQEYLQPLQTGLIGVLACSFLTNYIYNNYNRHALGYFSFLDRDGLLYGAGLVASFILGFLTVLIWPVFLDMIQQIKVTIGSDLTNPFNLMIYGFTEKILSLLWLPNLIRTPFLFGEAGGSWMADRSLIFGDIGVWTSQYDLDGIVQIGFGRFITVSYIVNLFMVPGVLIGMFSRTTNKTFRRRQLQVIALVAFAVLLAGNPIAVELTLLVVSPFLFGVYILIVGLLYLIPNTLQLYLGHSFVGDQRLIAPGNLLEFMRYGGDGNLQLTVYSIAIIGVVIALIMMSIVIVYFKKGGKLPGKKDKLNIDVHGLIVAFGGRSNIIQIDSSMSKITVQVENRGKVDIEALQQLGAAAIVQTRVGYSVVFGAQSVLIKDAMNEHLLESKSKEN